MLPARQGPYWCSYEAKTERQSTNYLDFSCLKLNYLKMTIKVTEKQFSNFFMKFVFIQVSGCN